MHLLLLAGRAAVALQQRPVCLLLLLPVADVVAKSSDRNQAMTIDSGSQSGNMEGNGKTVLTLRQLHPSAQRRNAVIGFGAVEYGYQTLDKLARHAATP